MHIIIYYPGRFGVSLSLTPISQKYSYFRFPHNWASKRENQSSGVCEQHMRRPACASAQSDQRLCFSLFEKYHMCSWYRWNFNFLASLCSWEEWFETRFVGSPKDRFCRDEAHFVYRTRWTVFVLFSDNFAVLAKVFSSDIVSQCTFCSSPENYYNVGFNSVTIDHVLYKGYKSVVSSNVE